MRTAFLGASLAFVISVSLCPGAHAQAPGAPAPAAQATNTGKPVATTFVVKFKVKPGRNAELEKAFREMQAGVRDHEPGNVYYDFLVSDQDPQTYFIVERYRDAEAVAAHGRTEHAKKVLAALKDLLDGAPEAQRLVLISAKD